MALAIWHACGPAEATLVQTYLAARGIELPLPDALRFHAGLKHPSGDIWPAMVALVTNGVDATPLAIHRTFLARDGSSKAPVDPQKMMLGPCRGGVVRLGDLRGAGAADAADADPSGRPPAKSSTGSVLMVGEGIETCLAAMQATGHPAWAALSTTGLPTDQEHHLPAQPAPRIWTERISLGADTKRTHRHQSESRLGS